MCGEPIPDGVDVWVHKQRLFTCDTNPKDLNKIFPASKKDPKPVAPKKAGGSARGRRAKATTGGKAGARRRRGALNPEEL